MVFSNGKQRATRNSKQAGGPRLKIQNLQDNNQDNPQTGVVGNPMQDHQPTRFGPETPRKLWLLALLLKMSRNWPPGTKTGQRGAKSGPKPRERGPKPRVPDAHEVQSPCQGKLSLGASVAPVQLFRPLVPVWTPSGVHWGHPLGYITRIAILRALFSDTSPAFGGSHPLVLVLV